MCSAKLLRSKLIFGQLKIEFNLALKLVAKFSKSPPCAKEGGARGATGGLSKKANNPSPPAAELPLHKGAFGKLHLNRSVILK